MRAGLTAIALFLFPALATAACKDEPAPAASADAGSDGGVPLGPEGVKFLADLCALYEPCCKPVPASAGKCTADAEGTARRMTFDADRAKVCLEALRAESKNTTFCTQAPPSITCGAVFKEPKTKAPGASCAKSSECSNGPDGDGLCVFQKCRRAPRGKDGDACIGTRADGRSENLPTPRTDIGALCFASEGLYCDPDSSSCKKRGAIGEGCAGSDISCVDEGWCPTTTKQCASRTAANASCTDPYECALGFQCANDGEGGGACKALQAEGGACERGDECDPRSGLVCDTDTTKCIEDTSVYDLACRGTLALFE